MTIQATVLAAAVAATAAACTTLGPMPAMTGTTPIPAQRDGVEVQVGGVPGHYLSESVSGDPHGDIIGQASLVVDVLRRAGLPGVVFGGRYVGKPSEGGYPEGFAGYRRSFGEGHFSLGVIGFGTHASGDNDGASYSATRAGAELAVDARMTPRSRGLELHVIGGVTATGMWADGTYCTTVDDRFALDCSDDEMPTEEASASGVYPTGHFGLALDGLRHRDSVFHGGRLALAVAAGMMPQVESGEQIDATTYLSLGLSLTVGVGIAD